MTLLLLTALGGDPAVALPIDPVERIPCARTVRFATPYPWPYQSPPGTLSEGTLLVVEADPGWLRPRDLGQRVLYVDGAPAEVLARDGARALVLAAGTPAEAGSRVYFADDTLPERVDAAHRRRVVAAAVGAPVLPILRRADPLHARSRAELLGAWC